MNVKKESNYDWVIFSQSYLLIARLGCQELMIPKHPSTDYKDFFKLEYKIHDLTVPIFYNVKHGIEIFIKTLSLFLIGEYNNKEHDLNVLFLKFKNEVDKKIKLKIFKPLKNDGNEITQQDIDNLPKNLEKLKKLIYEFYAIEILKPKLNQDFTIADKQNDIFRYPDNKALIKINWQEVLDKISKEDISVIQGKIQIIYDLFNSIGYILNVLLL